MQRLTRSKKFKTEAKKEPSPVQKPQEKDDSVGNKEDNNVEGTVQSSETAPTCDHVTDDELGKITKGSLGKKLRPKKLTSNSASGHGASSNSANSIDSATSSAHSEDRSAETNLISSVPADLTISRSSKRKKSVTKEKLHTVMSRHSSINPRSSVLSTVDTSQLNDSARSHKRNMSTKEIKMCSSKEDITATTSIELTDEPACRIEKPKIRTRKKCHNTNLSTTENIQISKNDTITQKNSSVKLCSDVAVSKAIYKNKRSTQKGTRVTNHQSSKPIDGSNSSMCGIDAGSCELSSRAAKSWAVRHQHSRNVLHYVSNASLGRISKNNKKAMIETALVSSVGNFEISHCDHPFSCRVTTIDWHPRLKGHFCVGSKHGDLGFFQLKSQGQVGLHKVKGFDGIGPGGYITALKFDPLTDEKFYTSSLDGRVCLGNVEKDITFGSTVLLATHSWEQWFCSLDVHKTENLLVAGHNNGWVSALSRTGQEIWKKRLHKGKVSHLEFSPVEPNLLCSASLDRTVCMWDIRMVVEKKPLGSLLHERGLNSAYFSLTDGTRLLTTDQFDEIRVYRAPFWHLETNIKHPHRFFQHLTPIKAYWLPYSDTIVCGRFPDEKNYPEYGTKRGVDVFDVPSGKRMFELRDSVHTGIISLCKLDRTGDRLLCAMGEKFLVWSEPSRTDYSETKAVQTSKDIRSGPGSTHVSTQSKLGRVKLKTDQKPVQTREEGDSKKRKISKDELAASKVPKNKDSGTRNKR